MNRIIVLILFLLCLSHDQPEVQCREAYTYEVSCDDVWPESEVLFSLIYETKVTVYDSCLREYKKLFLNTFFNIDHSFQFSLYINLPPPKHFS